MTCTPPCEHWPTVTDPDTIIRTVATDFGTDPAALTDGKQTRPYPRVRHIAMWLIAHHNPTLSKRAIGEWFGDRHGTTVNHGIRLITQARSERCYWALTTKAPPKPEPEPEPLRVSPLPALSGGRWVPPMITRANRFAYALATRSEPRRPVEG